MVTSEHERRLEALRRQRQGLRLAADRRRRRRREQLFAATALLGVTAVIAVLAPRMLAGDAVAPAPAASPTSPAALVGVCSYALDGTASPQVTGRPPARSTTTARTATLLTSRGRIVLRLLPEQAPCAVRSFAFLAARGYYDGSHCPRLTTGPLHFVECGEPPRGPGPGYAFASEALEGARYPRGTVGLANNGPGTSGGRFFLVYGDSPLPPSFTPFAVVTAGLDVLDGVAAGGARPERDGRPLVPLTLSTVRTAPR